MARNKVKIVANQEAGTVAYYFQNEKAEWVPVSSASLLSKREYRYAAIAEKAQEILEAINETYNYGDRGVNVLFEGSNEDFQALQSAMMKYFSGENMVCQDSKLKIAVVGKSGAGKTAVVEEVSRQNNIQLSQEEQRGYTIYQDKLGAVEWYVLEGIEIGKENIRETQERLDKLMLDNVSVFVYCVASSKIETLEERLITYIRDTYRSVRPIVLLTQGFDLEAERYAGILTERLGGIKVLPILARDKKTRGGVVPAFGLDTVSKYIFEGI